MKATADETSSQPPDAAQKVFETVELLEAILLNLPHKRLLINTRVCKTWNSVIKTSTSIQQKLFYQQNSPAGVDDNMVFNPVAIEILGVAGYRPAKFAANDDAVFWNRRMQNHKGYRKLLKQPDGVAKCSWEDMYATSQPAVISLCDFLRSFSGDQTTLGALIAAVDEHDTATAEQGLELW